MNKQWVTDMQSFYDILKEWMYTYSYEDQRNVKAKESYNPTKQDIGYKFFITDYENDPLYIILDLLYCKQTPGLTCDTDRYILIQGMLNRISADFVFSPEAKIAQLEIQANKELSELELKKKKKEVAQKRKLKKKKKEEAELLEKNTPKKIAKTWKFLDI